MIRFKVILVAIIAAVASMLLAPTQLANAQPYDETEYRPDRGV